MSRVIPGDSAPAVEAWQAPSVDATAAAVLSETEHVNPHMMTVEELESLQARARTEAWEQGRQEGLRAGAAEVQQRVLRLDQALQALAEPFRDLDQEVEQQLLTMVRALTRQLVRREMRIEPQQVVGVIRDAVSALPANSRDIRVHLHPADVDVVRECMGPEVTERAWRIEEDPVLEPGSCRVTSASSEIDARLETRLGRLISEMLGSDRGGDRGSDE